MTSKLTRLAVLIAIAAMLAGCGDQRLSGRYIRQDKSNEFFEFTDAGEWTNERGEEGTYRVEDGKVVIWSNISGGRYGKLVDGEIRIQAKNELTSEIVNKVYRK